MQVYQMKSFLGSQLVFELASGAVLGCRGMVMPKNLALEVSSR
jgi:hypothetical protein